MHTPRHESSRHLASGISPDIKCELPTCLELGETHMYIILVQIALKHELGLLPILRYETRVILHAYIERFEQSRRICGRERSVAMFAIKIIVNHYRPLRMKSVYRLPVIIYSLLTCVKSEIHCRWLILQSMHWLILDIWNVRVSWADRSIYLSLPSSFEFPLLKLRRNLHSHRSLKISVKLA